MIDDTPRFDENDAEVGELIHMFVNDDDDDEDDDDDNDEDIVPTNERMNTNDILTKMNIT